MKNLPTTCLASVLMVGQNPINELMEGYILQWMDKAQVTSEVT